MDSSKRTTAALLGLFVGSGCSALVYEIVWLQQLGLVLGATTISLTILLTSFMGGMCLGSLALPKLVSAARHPLRVYSVLEFLIAVWGLAILWLMPAVTRVYCSLGTPGSSDLIARALVALMLLLPPTFLMGATLPAIARWVRASRRGLSNLGFFYGANTFGAVVGCLLAGLYLLPFYDVVVATCVAAAINLSVAVAAWSLARTSETSLWSLDLELTGTQNDIAMDVFGVQMTSRSSFTAVVPYFVVGLSGLTALGSEFIWTRWLGLLFGPTTYTFSILLAVFLMGLGIGSWAGAWLSQRMQSPGFALAISQLLLMAAIPFGAWMIVRVLPYWLHTRDVNQSLLMRMSFDVVRATSSLLPATLLWGASFPLAVATVASNRRDSASLVGGLYSANTLGAIIGVLAVSLFAVPAIDGQFAQQMLTVFSAAAGVCMLVWQLGPTLSMRRLFAMRLSRAVLSVVMCVVATQLVPEVPKGLLAYGRTVERWPTTREYYFVNEGLDSPVVVSNSAEGFRCFHVAGKVEATNSPSDMRTQRLLGHLPAMVHPEPRSVLVVGCGSGMTTGAFLQHPTVERIVLCEMESNVIRTARQFFAEENGGVLDHPRLEIVIDDARHFLATTREKFDVITADPIHPWVRGAATLYTTEFYELCKSRLTPFGVVTQWVPLYESNEPAVKCEMATFLQVFPRSSLWSGTNRSTGYDLVVVGTIGDQVLSPRTIRQRLRSNPRVQDSLAGAGILGAEDLLNRFAGTAADLEDWLKDAEINRDRNLRLQYLAGLTPESQTAQEIFQSMVSRRRPIGLHAN